MILKKNKPTSRSYVLQIFFFVAVSCIGFPNSMFAFQDAEQPPAPTEEAENPPADDKKDPIFDAQEKVDLVPFNTVKIGDLIWSSQNLDVEIDGSWCYDDKDVNCQKYGRLYTWEAAKKIGRMFDGWRLPSKNDLDELISYFEVRNRAEQVLVNEGQNVGGADADHIYGVDESGNILLADLKVALIQARIDLQKAIFELERMRYGDAADNSLVAAQTEDMLDLDAMYELSKAKYKLVKLQAGTKLELAEAKMRVFEVKKDIAQKNLKKSQEVGERFGIAEARVDFFSSNFDFLEMKFVLAQIKLGLNVDINLLRLEEDEVDKERKEQNTIGKNNQQQFVNRYSPFNPSFGGYFDDFENEFFYSDKAGYFWSSTLSDDGKPYVLFARIENKEMKTVDFFRTSRGHSVRLVRDKKTE